MGLEDGVYRCSRVAGAAAIPLALRVCWWALVVADAVVVAAEIDLAQLLGRPYALPLWLSGPLAFGAMLAGVAWWHSRGPGRRWWSSPASSSSGRPEAAGAAILAVVRALWWCLVASDAVLLAAAIGAIRRFGPWLLVGLPGPLLLGLVLVGLIAWWHARGPGARFWRRPWH
jgi:hypothetical protein